MIIQMQNNDINNVMKIWITENLSAHKFIQKEYWLRNFDYVKSVINNSEVYVYKSENKICGFIGLEGDYIEGIFVDGNFQGRGIGKELLNFAKQIHNNLTLNVYEKNHGAVRFYKHEGFVIKSESVDIETGKKEYLMEWKR